MIKNILHALVFIQNWGSGKEVMDFLKLNNHVISIYHIMGRYSYLIDANFDNKEQLEEWIKEVKSLRLSSNIPSIITLRTQKIIDVYKQKDSFDLKDYKNLNEPFHFFMLIDNPHHDDKLISLLIKYDIINSVLHTQGSNSFIVEVITSDYNKYKELLSDIKGLNTINHIETLEVIIVIKYRNQIFDEAGNLIYPQKDLRELYTL